MSVWENILSVSDASMPSVLWHCWLGIRKSISPVNNYSVRKCSLLAWLAVWNEVQMICICASWCHCLPIISCCNKIQTGLTFLVLAYPDCSGKEAIKWVPLCLWRNGKWQWTANVKTANVAPCSEWESCFLTAHQHIIGHSVPYMVDSYRMST